jgi:hypothetical protein
MRYERHKHGTLILSQPVSYMGISTGQLHGHLNWSVTWASQLVSYMGISTGQLHGTWASQLVSYMGISTGQLHGHRQDFERGEIVVTKNPGFFPVNFKDFSQKEVVRICRPCVDAPFLDPDLGY